MAESAVRGRKVGSDLVALLQSPLMPEQRWLQRGRRVTERNMSLQNFVPFHWRLTLELRRYPSLCFVWPAKNPVNNSGDFIFHSPR